MNSVIINFDDEDDDDEDETTQPDEGTAEAEPSEAGAQSSDKVNESDDGPVRFPILPPELLPVDFEYPADAILIEPDEQMDELAHDVSILSCSEIDVTGCSSDLIMEEWDLLLYDHAERALLVGCYTGGEGWIGNAPAASHS